MMLTYGVPWCFMVFEGVRWDHFTMSQGELISSKVTLRHRSFPNLYALWVAKTGLAKEMEPMPWSPMPCLWRPRSEAKTK
jgi:hypothetical protein